MIKANRIITSCAILHNLMITQDYPDDWTVTDVDSLVDDDDDVNLPASQACDEHRQKIHAHFIKV